MRHILLLLPFLLFDLLGELVERHNTLHGADLNSPVPDLIAWVLVLLENSAWNGIACTGETDWCMPLCTMMHNV